MAGFLDHFRKHITSSVWKEDAGQGPHREIDDKIALGVLLWAVAEADNTFLPQEHEQIKGILKTKSKISDEDVAVVLEAVKEAARERIDLYQFTREVSADLTYDVKVSIIEDLFRVACSDRELDDAEVEIIRKISGLFRIYHKDFINAKLRVKKEFGIERAGL